MDTFEWKITEAFSELEKKESPSCCDEFRRILKEFRDWVFGEMATGRLMGVTYDVFEDWLDENFPRRTPQASEIWSYYKG